MTITPFLMVALRGKKDAVRARQRARRVASLLHFDVHQQACIAAGAFVISCQALALLCKPRLWFQIESRQLQIFAAEDTLPKSGPIEGARFARILGDVDPALYRLAKPLPAQQDTTEELDLGWLVQSVEYAAHETLFDEIVKQNQEVLALLHDLRLYQGGVQENAEKSADPHAA